MGVVCEVMQCHRPRLVLNIKRANCLKTKKKFGLLWKVSVQRSKGVKMSRYYNYTIKSKTIKTNGICVRKCQTCRSTFKLPNVKLKFKILEFVRSFI